MKKCLANNWNEDWLPVLKHAARYITSKYHALQESHDELINAAWINSVRRLPHDAPEKMVFSCASRSMAQYMVGKRDTREGENKKLNANMVSIYQESDNDFEFIEQFEDHQFNKCLGLTYDDVDELVYILQGEADQVRYVVCGMLAGYLQVEISEQLGLSPPRIHKLFKDFTRKAKNENKKSIAS